MSDWWSNFDCYRLSFELEVNAFLGFEFGDATPDENTIRHFRDRLTDTGALPVLTQFPNPIHV